MEPISGIEKLIGFIYRILFTIIPSGAFLCVSMVFLSFVSNSAIESLISFFSGINSFWQVLLPLCLIFSLSLFLESIDLLLFYYMMDFGNLTNLRLFGLGSNSSLENLKNRDFNELYRKTDDHTSIRKFVERSHYTLGLIKSLMHHPRVFSHIYYQLGREFVFNNLTVVILLISNCFIPYVIDKYDGNNSHYRYITYQILQPIFTIFYLILSYIFLKEYNAYKSGDEKLEVFDGNNVLKIFTSGIIKYFKNLHKMPHLLFIFIIAPLIFSSICFALAISFQNSYLLFIAFNFSIFPVVLAMVFKGFKEYMEVEKYYLAYFIERHFLKSNKERHVKEWNFRRTLDYPDADFTKHLAPQILDVYEDGMGSKGWSIAEIAKQKTASTLLGLLEDSDKDIFGYCFVTIPAALFQRRKILWIDACSISRDLQSEGYYKKAIKKVIGLYDRNSFGYLGGRTQNPVIMYSHDKYCEGKFLPFDDLYPDELMQFLIMNIPEVREVGENLDKEKGLCKKAYNGILGEYPKGLSKGRCSQFEEELKTFGFNRDEGDAIIVLKELN